MDAATVILVLVIVTALAFDFTNGFHDTGNAMATSIATGALAPKVAVGLSAILNLVGAFLSVEVALTITNAVVDIQDPSGAPRADLLANGGQALLLIILAGLVGGIAWNLFTWLYGLPSSSSHALLGGLVGSTIAGLGFSGVKWTGEGDKLGGVVGKILLPAVLSPVIAIVVAAVGTWLVFKITEGVTERYRQRGFRWGQVGSASLVSLAHGTNDAQKTMGVITLALIANGNLSSESFEVPFWVVVSAATAIAAGTYTGGWRIIRTMGTRIIKMDSAQGFTAQGSGAAVILASSHFGFPLSTTHVIAGGVMGSGAGKRLSAVRWGVAGNMLTAWLVTLPAAAAVGAASYGFTQAFGGGAIGPLLLFALAAVLGLALFARRLRQGQPVPAT